MERDIKAVALILITQGMINLGEMHDPVLKKPVFSAEKAGVFIDLLEVLEKKTRGNLTEGENLFITQSLANLKRIYREKISETEC